jgi:predicted dehydrogenase
MKKRPWPALKPERSGPVKTIKIGFIGAGDVSILHAEAIRRCPGAELVGLWNITPELADQKSRLFGCRIYPSAEALVNDPELDAVFVLTNLETHLKYALLALQAGKHVLVEKPVGVTIAEIEQLKTAAAQAGVICMPGHNYVYEESLSRSRELIQQGELGQLVSIYVLYNIHHPESVAAKYPGVIRQILTHHAYILLYLAGPPVSLSAMKATLHYQTISQEDIAIVNLRLQNGALAHFCASFAADDHAGDPWTVLIKVIGTAGSTRYSYRDWVELKPGIVHAQTYSAYQYSMVNEVRHFINHCIRHGEPPLSTLDDAITAQKIIEACEASVEQGRTVEII